MKYNQWLKRKPTITEDCIMITATNIAGVWHYGKFKIGINGTYFIAGIDEYNNVYTKDIKADRYFLIQQL